MAHQISSDVPVNSRHKEILKRRELAALLGEITNEWSALEADIMYIYAMLMGMFLPREKGERDPMTFRSLLNDPPVHPVATQVFDTLENLPNRLKLLEKLATWTLRTDQALLERLKETIIPLIKKTSRRRAKFVHAMWGTSDDYPDALILIPAFGKYEAYEASDFNETIDFIIRTVDAVREFNVDVIAFLRKRKA